MAEHPLRGKLPSRRLNKEELARTHKSHLKKQDLTPDAPRPVKQPLLDQAYPASTRSIRDLEIVSLNMKKNSEHRVCIKTRSRLPLLLRSGDSETTEG
jgi:hypothetical protein